MTYILLGPYLGALLAPTHAKIPFVVTIALIWTQYIGMARTSDTRWWYMFTHPVAAALFIYTMLRSMFVTLARGGIEWRGTTYPLAQIRKHQ